MLILYHWLTISGSQKTNLHSHLTYFGTAVQRYGVLSARADKPLTKTLSLLYV